jgi:hypothetical protein
VIIDRAGYVVTNAHVVMNAQRVQVTLPNLPDVGAAAGVDAAADRDGLCGRSWWDWIWRRISRC